MCMLGSQPGCAKEQTISCKTDWRLLVSLWRTDPLYHELKESHSSYEAVHDWWRDRYKVAADDIGIRPKVRSIGWHRLRANVAAVVEWLRICSREGWLGSARRNHGEPERGFQETGRRIASRLADMRVVMGVAAAYGANAEPSASVSARPRLAGPAARRRARPRWTSTSPPDRPAGRAGARAPGGRWQWRAGWPREQVNRRPQRA
jgi:hypothetical protein